MKIPRIFRPRSILRLILLGFALVLIPLGVAFGVFTLYMNKIAGQSQVLVRQAIKSTQDGRVLVSELTAMERSALQYMVVRDGELLELYRQSHVNFQESMSELFKVELTPEQRVALLKLNRSERDLFEEFGAPLAAAASGEKPIAWFARARDLAQEFLVLSDAWVEREVLNLQTLADSTNRMLFWVVVAVVPTIFVLVGVFTVLIARPLRSISNAIYRLGSEDFDTPLVVRGPRDVEDLGKRLNWLRLQLGELEEQKARFLRHMSHELKTPLTGLREGAELLAEEVIGTLNEDQRQVVAIMRENTLMFQELIVNLVNFNQALLRNQVMNYEKLRLNDVVRRVVASQQLAWKAKDLAINLDLEDAPLVADRSKLTTVVDNLLSNAIKFSPRGGNISIGLKVRSRTVELEVRDAGPGFHPDDQTQVFEAFYQGKFVPDSHVKGSGLGLAIAREYTESHGGKIAVIGGGSGGHVRLELPLAQEVLA